MSTKSVKVTPEQLQLLNDAFNRHDVNAVMEHIHDDCVLTMPMGTDPWGEKFEGKATVRAAFEARLNGLPDARWEDSESWVCGDRGVTTWTLRATMPDGSRMERWGCDIYEFKDGMVLVKHSFWKILK